MEGRFFRDERGFTLTEMLITALMMTTVLFALYSIFDTGLRIVGLGNASMEATENARLGLTKMEREIRAAYPQENASNPSTIVRNTTLFTSFGANQMSFGNDLNGNRMVDSSEQITYSLSGNTLTRNNEPMINYVQNLTFTYLPRQGNIPVASEANIQRVRIDLGISIPANELGNRDAVNQTISTEVALRNRGG